jgi:hypothetical protein
VVQEPFNRLAAKNKFIFAKPAVLPIDSIYFILRILWVSCHYDISCVNSIIEKVKLSP